MQIEKLVSIRQNLQELLTRADSTPEPMNIRRLGQLQAEQRQRQDEQPITISDSPKEPETLDWNKLATWAILKTCSLL